jgi:hypothetical protein
MTWIEALVRIGMSGNVGSIQEMLKKVGEDEIEEIV